MVEPWIDSETMVGEWDPDALGWSAHDWVPGPAGTVGLTLPGGVELDVDVAAPRQFVGLWVEADRSGRPAPTTVATVRSLLGDARARELLRGRNDRPRPLRSDDRSDFERRRAWELDEPGSPSSQPGVAPALARHALAAATASELGASALVQALALVDAALATGELRDLGLSGRGRDAAEQGVSMLLDLRDELGVVDPFALGDALRRLRSMLPPALAEQARALAGDLDEPMVASRAESAPIADRARPEMQPSVAAAPAARLLPVDVATLPESLAVVEAAARATTPSEVEVHLPARPDLAERPWARAFAADGTLVAAAPFLDVADDAVARLLVPPATLRHATLDLADRPGEPRQPSSLRATVDAVHHGRAAARAERLGDRKESYSRWSRTAEAWLGAGDGHRATLAMRYAEAGDRDGRVPPALLADGAVEAGGG